jgi:hypothetical protein
MSVVDSINIFLNYLSRIVSYYGQFLSAYSPNTMDYFRLIPISEMIITYYQNIYKERLMKKYRIYTFAVLTF